MNSVRMRMSRLRATFHQSRLSWPNRPTRTRPSPLVPVVGEALQVAGQVRGGRLLVHRRADHVQRADAAVVERVERRIGMLGAARRMAGVDDGGDAGIERGDRRQLGAEIHVERAIVRAQRLGDDVDIGEEIVDIGHHAAHDAEPHMMVGVDEARHDDAAGGVDHLGAVRLRGWRRPRRSGRRRPARRRSGDWEPSGSIVTMVPPLKRVRPFFCLLMVRSSSVCCANRLRPFIAPAQT